MTPDNPVHPFLRSMTGNMRDQPARGGPPWPTVAPYRALSAGSLSMPGMWCPGTLRWLPPSISGRSRSRSGRVVAGRAGHTPDNLLVGDLPPALRRDGLAARALAFTF